MRPKTPRSRNEVAPHDNISRRVIRKRRRLRYLTVGIDPAVATGDDPLLDNTPALAHTMTALVTQRLAFGERAGQNVRRIGSGFGDAGKALNPKDPAVPVYMAFPGTPIRGFRRIGVISESV